MNQFTTPITPYTSQNIAKHFDVLNIRKDFPQLSQYVNGVPFVYLDSAATTQKPRSVIEKMKEYYFEYNANVHRAIYSTGVRATEEFESVRKKVAEFIHAESTRNIVFTRGSTEGINLVAYAWARNKLRAGDEVLLTEMEHHSNIIPWQLALKGSGVIIRYLPILHDGTLDLNSLDSFLSMKTKIVSLTHQSNVFGTINPIEQIAQRAHDAGALVFVDAAQSVPHMPIDVKKLGCDFLVFSGHKMIGPTGVGVLYGKEEILENMDPFMGGGEMIDRVTKDGSTWNEIPWKFEAGTPNVAQVIGLGAAIDYLLSIGMNNITQYEQELTNYALSKLKKITNVRIHGSAPHRGCVFSFEVKDLHPHDLAQLLDVEGIAIRVGHHCAQLIMDHLGVSATSRASLYFYNTKEEIDALCSAVYKAQVIMGVN